MDAKKTIRKLSAKVRKRRRRGDGGDFVTCCEKTESVKRRRKATGWVKSKKEMPPPDIRGR